MLTLFAFVYLAGATSAFSLLSILLASSGNEMTPAAMMAVCTVWPLALAVLLIIALRALVGRISQ